MSYNLTVVIHNPSMGNNLERIDVWTDISPQILNIPGYILNYGFSYTEDKERKIERYISPHSIISVYYQKELALKGRGVELHQI